MSKEIALDLRRYDTPEKLASLINDTASLSIEASDTELPRINPSFFVKKGDNYVVAPGRDKRDVMQMFVPNDKATSAAEKIRDMLINDDRNNTYVWISPSGDWPETRIQVGAKMATKGKNFDYLKRYDISTKVSPTECLNIAQLLVSMSSEGGTFPRSPEDLKDMVIKLSIPPGQNPFEVLSKFIILPEKNVWKSIINGTVEKNKAMAVKAAVIATLPVRMNPQVIYSSPVEYGAYIETMMAHEGFGMDPERFGCGSSNIESLASSGYSYIETTTMSLSHKDRYGSLKFRCPKCDIVNTRQIDQLLTNCLYCGNDVRC